MAPISADDIQDGFPGERSIILPRPILRRLSGYLSAIHLTDLGFYPHAGHHHVVRPMGCTELVLLYCTAGQGWVEVSGNRHPLACGDLACLPPGVPHEYGTGGLPWSIYWFHISGEWLREMPIHLGLTLEAPVRPVPNSVGFAEAFEEIYQTLEQGDGIDRLFLATGALVHLIGKLAVDRTSGTEGEGSRSQVLRVRDWMRANPRTNMAVPDLAAMAHLSTSHFSALFRQMTGYSVLDYYTRSRMQRACQLLDGTDLPIGQIAEAVGYPDQLYFSRLFRTVYGLSPRTYRREAKG